MATGRPSWRPVALLPQRDVRSALVEMAEKQIPTATAPRQAPHSAPATNIIMMASPEGIADPIRGAIVAGLFYVKC